MGGATTIAITTSSVALLAAVFITWLTAPWLRPTITRLEDGLDQCRRERDSLRVRVDLLETALLRLLPYSSREALRVQLEQAGAEAA